MERVTLRIPERQINEAEQLAEEGEYPNRSEVIRAGLRKLLKEKREERAMRRGASMEYAELADRSNEL